MTKNIFLHMRFPFSIFLLPIFLLAIFISPNFDLQTAVLLFTGLHLFVYPGSNAYNSYYDKDEGPIGGLMTPPKVEEGLLWTSIAFQIIGTALVTLASVKAGLLVVLYNLVSNAYSHPDIRIKKYPLLSWLVVSLFQGPLIYFLTLLSLNDFDMTWATSDKTLSGALFCFLFIGGSYPISQIFQHDEDARRGDKTLSLFLGAKGTIVFSGLTMTLSFLALYYALSFGELGLTQLALPAVFNAPSFILFSLMGLHIFRGQQANYKETFRVIVAGGIGANLTFLGLLIL
jgi:1,4-dihydroxy-2-naphthoate octaprenyltransferase